MNGWHRCMICGVEFFDPAIAGFWSYCPSCFELMDPKKAASNN